METWTFTLGGYGLVVPLRKLMFYTVSASNVSFLISLLLSMLLYLEIGENEKLKRRMILVFSIGVLALILSIVLFTASFVFIIGPYSPD